jgi:hypothetical protein
MKYKQFKTKEVNMINNRIDILNERKSANDFFKKSIKNLSYCRSREFNKVLTDEYVFLFNVNRDIYACGLDLDGLKNAINKLSMKPHLNGDYVQIVLDNGLISLIDGPVEKPAMKFFCKSSYVKKYLKRIGC